MKVDATGAIGALALLDTTEIGTRRRLAEALEEQSRVACYGMCRRVAASRCRSQA
jgi:hypothetical protein